MFIGCSMWSNQVLLGFFICPDLLQEVIETTQKAVKLKLQTFVKEWVERLVFVCASSNPQGFQCLFPNSNSVIDATFFRLSHSHDCISTTNMPPDVASQFVPVGVSTSVNQRRCWAHRFSLRFYSFQQFWNIITMRAFLRKYQTLWGKSFKSAS